MKYLPMKYLLSTTALAATLLIGAPALAQQSPYDTNPTPAERAQTDRLNQNAAAAAQEDPAAQDQDNDDDADQAQAPAVDQRPYADNTLAHRWDAFYGHENFRGLTRMTPDTLIGLRVADRGGATVGHVRDIQGTDNGISRVLVSTGGGRSAWLDADDLRYDPANNMVATDLTADQVSDRAVTPPRY